MGPQEIADFLHAMDQDPHLEVWQRKQARDALILYFEQFRGISLRRMPTPSNELKKAPAPPPPRTGGAGTEERTITSRGALEPGCFVISGDGAGGVRAEFPGTARNRGSARPAPVCAATLPGWDPVSSRPDNPRSPVAPSIAGAPPREPVEKPSHPLRRCSGQKAMA